MARSLLENSPGLPAGGRFSLSPQNPWASHRPAPERFSGVVSRVLGIPNLHSPSPQQRDRIHGLVGNHWQEFLSLAEERDPAMFYEGLLQLGHRLEGEDRLAAAVAVYSEILSTHSATNPGPSVPEDVRRRAQQHLDAIHGVGGSGLRAEFLLRRLAHEATEPTALFGMAAASTAFRVTRLATLSRLAATPSANFLTRGFGARALAGLTAFGVEATVFPAATRLGNLALGRELDWSPGQLGRELAGSFLVLGGLKFAGLGSTGLYQRIQGFSPALRRLPLQGIFQQGGMLSGIMLGHRLEEAFGLRPHQDGATTLTDSLAMLLQFNVAGRLTHGIFGEGFRRREAEMDLQAEALGRSIPRARTPWWNFRVPTIRPAGASSIRASDISSANLLHGPTLMERNPTGPHSSRTSEARRIAPRTPEAGGISNRTGPSSPPYSANFSPSGLVIRPQEGPSLTEIVQAVVRQEGVLPNRRMVLDIRDWRDAQEISPDQKARLQALADEHDISICLRTREAPFSEEFDPVSVRQDPNYLVPRLAMPGMSMSFSMRMEQRLEQRLELRLELSMRLEQRLEQRAEIEALYDDLWVPEQIPPQISEIRSLLQGMSQAQAPGIYLRGAEGILDRLPKIHNPYFRMLAASHLAEELASQPSLEPFVRELYSQELSRNLKAAAENEAPSLYLMVAASQLRANLDSPAIPNLVTHAIELAAKGEIDMRGSDSRNFEAILRAWARTPDRLEIAKHWIDAFVRLERWRHPPEENKPTGVEAEEPEAPVDIPPRELNPLERQFARSRIIHRYMQGIAESAGPRQETFRTLMALATHDAWEETAVVAYRLLAPHSQFQGALRGALSHFSSPYYRGKAALALAEANGEDTAPLRQALRQIPEGERGLNPHQLAHERFFLDGTGPDPFEALAPADWRPETAVQNPSEIEAQADRLTSEWRRMPGAEEVEGIRAEQLAVRQREREEQASRLQHRGRRGELYGILARGILSHQLRSASPSGPAPSGLLKGMLKLVGEGDSPRTLLELIREFPAVIDTDVSSEARKQMARLAPNLPYFRHQLELMLALRVPLPLPTGKYFKAFLESAYEEAGVSNAEVISDLARLGQEGGLKASERTRLLSLANKRTALYRQKSREGEEEAAEEVIEDETPSENQPNREEIWAELHEQSRSLLAGSQALDGKSLETLVRAANKVRTPFHRGRAFRILANRVLRADPRSPISADLMERAIASLEPIESQALQVALGMEILDDLVAHPKYRELREIFPEKLQNPLAQYEAARLLNGARRTGQGDWFRPENYGPLLRDNGLVPELLGRFVTWKQLSKMLRKGGLDPSEQASLLLGLLRNGPQQGAFDILKSLLEAEEGKDASEYLPDLYRAFRALLDQRDPRSGEYLMGRGNQILQAAAQRSEPLPLSQQDWTWILIMMAHHQGARLQSLIYSSGLTVEDRITLLETLARTYVLDPGVLATFSHLKSMGKAHLFFEIVEGLEQHLPRVRITPQVLDDLLKDPRVVADEAMVQRVIREWAESWRDFDRLDRPMDRIRALLSNPYLAETYYRQESGKYDFGNQKFDQERFLRILRTLQASPFVQDFTPISRWERALERAHPTTEEERGLTLRRIEEEEGLEPEAKDFLKDIARGGDPLTEEQIQRIQALSRETDIPRLIGYLPPNRQRAYHLYFGGVPTGHVEPGYQRDYFIGRFSSEAKAKAALPLDVAVQFRLAYTDLGALIQANASIGEMARLLRESREKMAAPDEHQREWEALLQGEGSLEPWTKSVSRLHTRMIAELEHLTLPQARGRLTTWRRDFLNQQILPALIAEKSHFVAADSHWARSLRARENTEGRRFDQVHPGLEAFVTRQAELTERKRAIAGRLNLHEGWERGAGEKALVEAELFAEIAGLRPELRERYFDGLREMMHRHADAQREKMRDAYSQGQATSKGFYEVSYLDKTDIYPYLRIGDFRPCCIATDGQFFSSTIPGFFWDKMTQVFAIVDPDNRKAVGHMVGHFGLSGAGEEPAYFLNGLYLRTQHRGQAQEAGAFTALEDFARLAGVRLIRHGINPYHDLTNKPPEGFTPATSQTVRLQSILDNAGKPIPLYNDLGFDREGVNQPQETTHYQRRVGP